MENLIIEIPLEKLKRELAEVIKKEISLAMKECFLNSPADEYLTRPQVAQILSISIATVGLWTKSGKITGYRIGNKVRFKKGEILKCLSKIKTE